MTPDRGHLHHRLIDMGFSQRSAVIILYGLSAILAISAIVMFVSNFMRAFVLFLSIVLFAVFTMMSRTNSSDKQEEENSEAAPDANGQLAQKKEPEKTEK